MHVSESTAAILESIQVHFSDINSAFEYARLCYQSVHVRGPVTVPPHNVDLRDNDDDTKWSDRGQVQPQTIEDFVLEGKAFRDLFPNSPLNLGDGELKRRISALTSHSFYLEAKRSRHLREAHNEFMKCGAFLYAPIQKKSESSAATFIEALFYGGVALLIYRTVKQLCLPRESREEKLGKIQQAESLARQLLNLVNGSYLDFGTKTIDANISELPDSFSHIYNPDDGSTTSSQLRAYLAQLEGLRQSLTPDGHIKEVREGSAHVVSKFYSWVIDALIPPTLPDIGFSPTDKACRSQLQEQCDHNAANGHLVGRKLCYILSPTSVSDYARKQIISMKSLSLFNTIMQGAIHQKEPASLLDM